MDQKLQKLKRILNSDPDNVSVKVQYLKLRARITGDSDSLLEPLLEKRVWKGTPDLVQDLAIQEVASRLGKDWELIGDETFSFTEQKIGLTTLDSGLTVVSPTMTTSYRIAYFTHIKTKNQFNLIPGGSLRDPCPCRSQNATSTCQICEGTGYIFSAFSPRLVSKKPLYFEKYEESLSFFRENDFNLFGLNTWKYLVLADRDDEKNIEFLKSNPFGLEFIIDIGKVEAGFNWDAYEYTYAYEYGDENAMMPIYGTLYALTFFYTPPIGCASAPRDITWQDCYARPIFEIPGLKV